jgi:hypothetical protein
MSNVVFKRGQEVAGRDGLSIFLKGKDGTPKNVAEITYSIYDNTTGTEVLLNPPNRPPVNSGVGEYSANFFIPIDANLGEYRIRWYTREYINSRQVEIVQKFAIVENQTQIVNLPGSSSNELDLVRGLRIMLRDNSPGRNYHFTPPTGEESINKYNRVFGYLWEDAELLEFLNFSNDSINMYPPRTGYATLDQLMQQQRTWRTLLITGAMVHAINAMALNWISEEFDYTIGGVSLSIEKSSKYQSMASDAQARFQEFITQAKDTLKFVIGLKQSKYGIGIRSAFGPSLQSPTISPRRFIGV